MKGNNMQTVKGDIPLKRKAKAAQKPSTADRVAAHMSRHNDVGDVGRCADQARRDACRLDLRLFLETYHAATCVWPFSAAHLKLIADLQHVILHGGRKLTAMPRGSGKTSICIAAAEWAVLYGHRRFVVVPASTQDSAENIVAAIYADLEGNELIAADFPAVCKPFAHLRGVRQRCKAQHQHGAKTDIVLTTDEIVVPYALEDGETEPGPACGGRVFAAGLTGHIRGTFRVPREGGRLRPDLVLLDDPQTRDSAKSETQTLDRIRLIDGDVMRLAGHGREIAAMMPCTVICKGDLAEHYLAKENWQGQRVRAVEKWSGGVANRDDIPEAQAALLDEYRSRWLAEITKEAAEGSARVWYEANRTEIEAGAEVFWADMYDHAKEVSAYQHCLHLLWSDGEYSFDAELQQDPKSDRPEAEYTLTADAVRKQVGPLARGAVPEDAASTVAFVDINYHAAAWTVMSASHVPCYSVVDYGWWTPGRGRPLWSERDTQHSLEVAIYRACESVVAMLLAAPYGSAIRAIAIDCGSKWAATVHAACKMLMARHNPPPVYAAKGFSSAQYKEPYKRQLIKRRGHAADIRFMSPDREQMMQWDSHSWHMTTQRGWLIPIGMPGSVCLFKATGQLTHAQFAAEAAADMLEGIQEVNGKAKVMWKTLGRNEMGDVTAGAAALLSTEGVRTDSADNTKAARRAARKARKEERRAGAAKPAAAVQEPGTVPAVKPVAAPVERAERLRPLVRRASWATRW